MADEYAIAGKSGKLVLKGESKSKKRKHKKDKKEKEKKLKVVDEDAGKKSYYINFIHTSRNSNFILFQLITVAGGSARSLKTFLDL